MTQTTTTTPTVPPAVMAAVALKAVEMVRVLDNLLRTETVRTRHVELVRARDTAQTLAVELQGLL